MTGAGEFCAGALVTTPLIAISESARHFGESILVMPFLGTVNWLRLVRAQP
jgi:hypothetical protein